MVTESRARTAELHSPSCDTHRHGQLACTCKPEWKESTLIRPYVVTLSGQKDPRVVFAYTAADAVVFVETLYKKGVHRVEGIRCPRPDEAAIVETQAKLQGYVY